MRGDIDCFTKIEMRFHGFSDMQQQSIGTEPVIPLGPRKKPRGPVNFHVMPYD
jgi:hypothetical protein